MQSLVFVIPAYGRSPYLEQCIQSLLVQTVACSIRITTSTPSEWLLEIANKYGIEIFINQESKCIADDWNFALKNGGPNLITIAHQDDVYLIDYAENIIKYFQDHPDSAIAFSDMSELANEKRVNWNLRTTIKKVLLQCSFLASNTVKKSISYRVLLSLGCPVPCPAVAYNKFLLHNFSFSREYQVNLDWNAWVTLINQGMKIGYIKKVLVLHRIHKDAETQKAIISRQREREDLRIYHQFWPKWVVACLIYLYRLGY
mgnify:CR=1 FL=1